MADDLSEKLNAVLADPEAMGRILSLARSLSGPAQAEAPPPPEPAPREAPPGEDPLAALGSLDPRLVQLGMRLLREYQRKDDRKTALLAALRPFVKEDRYSNVDRAVQIARLSRLIRVALDAGTRGEGSAEDV